MAENYFEAIIDKKSLITSGLMLLIDEKNIRLRPYLLKEVIKNMLSVII